MTAIPPGVVVLAIGGNSLIRDQQHQLVSDQFAVASETCAHIEQMLEMGWRVVITHGNGPQVGFILRRSELSLHELHPVPLDSISADTQGAIGYMLQQSLANELTLRGVHRQVVTVITQVRVDADDPAFQNPSKPIGSFMSEEAARAHQEIEGWNIVEDAGRGWRRVIASPFPREILERDAIVTLLERGFVVIAAGGGGIPVARDAAGKLRGVSAVIDKDHASSLLARQIGADLFVISTAVDAVYLDFGKPTQRAVHEMSLSEAKRHIADGQFPPGSMGPKMEAVVSFLEGGGKEALISSPEYLEQALAGEAGTRIYRD
jgi:carbamate kinase